MSGSFAATHAYEGAGVYSITVTVRDLFGMTASAQERVIVFDPAGGWVTGGAFSPLGGARPSSPAASGSAHFAFTAKHKPGSSEVQGSLELKVGCAPRASSTGRRTGASPSSVSADKQRLTECIKDAWGADVLHEVGAAPGWRDSIEVAWEKRRVRAAVRG